MVEVVPQPEEAIRRKGIQALRQCVDAEELLSFPRRPNGIALMLKQSLFERLLSGKTQLSSFPASDVSAAQGDLRHLSLEQLLALHSTQGEAPTSSAGTAMSAFWNSLETSMVERLAARLQRSNEAAATVPPQRRRLHWEVQLCERPNDFKEKLRGSLRAPRPAPRGQRAGYPAAPKEVVFDEEATETETEDEAPKPGSRPRVVAAGLCSEEQARSSIQREGMAKIGVEDFSQLQEELKLAKAAEAVAQEEISKIAAELQTSRESEVLAQQDLAKMKENLKAAEDAKALAEEEVSKMKEEIKLARDAEAKTAERVSELEEGLKKSEQREVELREQLAEARTAEVSAQTSSDLQWELMTAKDSEAQLKEQLAEAKSAEAQALARAKLLEDRLEATEEGGAAMDVDISPSSTPKTQVEAEATVDAALKAVASIDEDADSFASFESCEGGLVFRSPQKEL